MWHDSAVIFQLEIFSAVGSFSANSCSSCCRIAPVSLCVTSRSCFVLRKRSLILRSITGVSKSVRNFLLSTFLTRALHIVLASSPDEITYILKKLELERA